MYTLDHLFTEQVARTPHAPAVADAHTELTYAELDGRANHLAHLLRVDGVGPDVPVAIAIDRTVDLVVAVLGVLKAGGAYVPIEPGTPDARVAEILDAASARICLTSPADAGRIHAMGRRSVTIPATAAASGPVAGTTPDNLAAIYFTSGSTGTPKGVACPHSGWVNRMEWMQRRHGLRPGETVLHKTTLTFDDAAVELFWPLAVGGRVAVLEPGAHRDPRAIIDAAIRYETVHLQFVPSIFDLVLETLTDEDEARLDKLRSVLCSGEALRPNSARRFFVRFGDRVRLDNTWGVTEASIDSTYHACQPEDGSAGLESVPIGVDIPGNEVRLLDASMRPVGEGQTGELYIGGCGLARGYVGDPGRTARVFVPDPAGSGARLYRTGDLAVRRPDGALVFLGRADAQVKIHGVRIELGEVEAALCDHPGVAAAAAVAVADGLGGKRLAAFVVSAPGTDPVPVRDLRAYLATRLTGYAIPGAISVVDHLPLHPNGKIDRQALASGPARELKPDEEPYLAPRTTAEETVAAIWGAVLGGDRIGVDRNFFEVGGNSLLAIRVLSRLRQAYELNLPMKSIFDNPTIAATAATVEELLLADLSAEDIRI